MDLIIRLLVDGLCTGARYSLLGMGFALIFNTQRMFDLSFGGIYTWSGFALWILANQFGLDITFASGVVLVFSFGLSHFIQKIYMARLRERSASAVSIMLGSMAVMMMMEAIATVVWGGEIRPGRTGDAGVFRWGTIQISDIKLYTLLSAVSVFVLVRYLFMKTPLGINARAIASNARTSLGKQDPP